MTIPPIPTDFSQLAQWLLMPSILTLIANLVINAFFVSDNVQQKSAVKFIVFAVVGFVSFGLTKLAPDFVASIEPLWAILAGVIAAYYAPTVVVTAWNGLRLLGLRMLFGQVAAQNIYIAMNDPKAAHG